VSKFVRENNDLCRNMLVKVRAAFNPISEYLRNPTQYPPNPMLLYPERN
jgi:hypothetical protein